MFLDLSCLVKISIFCEEKCYHVPHCYFSKIGQGLFGDPSHSCPSLDPWGLKKAMPCTCPYLDPWGLRKAMPMPLALGCKFPSGLLVSFDSSLCSISPSLLLSHSISLSSSMPRKSPKVHLCSCSKPKPLPRVHRRFGHCKARLVSSLAPSSPPC